MKSRSLEFFIDAAVAMIVVVITVVITMKSIWARKPRTIDHTLWLCKYYERLPIIILYFVII